MNYKTNLKICFTLRHKMMNVNFFMIYIIHKVSVSLKNHPNYLKDSNLNVFSRTIKDFYFFLKKY